LTTLNVRKDFEVINPDWLKKEAINPREEKIAPLG
jgi:hypothetical protein